ncbi:TPA: superinfection exclusion B family protein [Bacillus cereus]|nr:superinfection exclusion B family protein [Bacillus cereus]
MKIDIKEILTLPNNIMAGLTLATGILLFSPNSFLEKLFMLSFREKHGFIIGIVFIVSLSILVINLINRTAKVIHEKNTKKKFYATAEKRLKSLNTYQKYIIYALYNEHNRTLPLPLHDGAVIHLEDNHMIGKAAKTFMVSDLNNAQLPYFLQPWVAEELAKKPDLLSHFASVFESERRRSRTEY